MPLAPEPEPPAAVQQRKTEAVDIERVGFRLDGLETYALVVSMTAGFGFSSLEMVSDEDFKFLGPPFALLFAVTVPLSVLSGIYAMLVFSLCSMYAKTAIGSHKDEAMKHFMQETGIYRLRAFRYFLVSVSCFAIDVSSTFDVVVHAYASFARTQVLVISLAKFRSRFAVAVAGVCASVMFAAARDTERIIQIAAPIFGYTSK